MVTSTFRGSIVSMVQSSLAGTLTLASTFFTARMAKAGITVTPGQAFAASEIAAAEVLSAPGNFSLANNADLLKHMRSTFEELRRELRSVGRGRLLQEEVDNFGLSFDEMAAEAEALAESAAEANAVVAEQQNLLVDAVANNVTMDVETIKAKLMTATKAAASQVTALTTAAQQLGNGSISAATFKQE